MAKFGGKREGHVFKTGELGLGYYADHTATAAEEAAAMADAVPKAEAAVVAPPQKEEEEEEEEECSLAEALGLGGRGQVGGVSDVCSLLDSAHAAASALESSGGLALCDMDELD